MYAVLLNCRDVEVVLVKKEVSLLEYSATQFYLDSVCNLQPRRRGLVRKNTRSLYPRCFNLILHAKVIGNGIITSKDWKDTKKSSSPILIYNSYYISPCSRTGASIL